MTPLDYYRNECGKNTIVEDQQQLAALNHIQKLYDALLKEQQKRSSLFAFLRTPRLVQGLYMWGGVGIGKTFLMDCFYHCIPFPQKIRMHFHEFMQFIHVELKKHQGKKDPLQFVAKELAQKTTVLCFDELFVSDITDAMLLARLFKALFSRGVCLVATSNAMPDDLYKNGLQRKLFLPAIEMLKQHTQVIHIASTVDYRLRHLKNVGVFHVPNDDAAHEKMEQSFAILAHGASIMHDPIKIHGRYIPIKKQAGDIIWFDFNVICAVPRSQRDYLAIAKKYHTIFISGVPVIAPNAKDTISLFIRLIDVLYDARIRLIFSAADLIDKIYSHGSMIFEYTRTRSRLLEMQSEKYFSHRFPNHMDSINKF